MIIRGRFRPLTLVNMDMFESGLATFKQDPDVEESNILEIAELTLQDLSSQGKIDEADFLDRVDILGSMGKTVMISNYHEYYKLLPFISNYTRQMKIGIVLGILSLEKVFDEQFYQTLDGGILAAFGQLFGRNVKVFVYPSLKPGRGDIYTCKDFAPRGDLSYLFKVPNPDR